MFERGGTPILGDRALLGLIVALAAVLRFSTLDLQSLWYDEAVTAVGVLKPNLLDTIEGIPERESTPPLYYMLLWGWTKLFGTGEVGLRSLSALVGTATVPMAYLAGRGLVSRRAGLVAALLVAASPLLINYSQEARSYALVVFLCTAGLAAFAHVGKHPRALMLWAVCSALALLTHYFAAMLVIPEAVWLLATADRRARAAAWVGGVMAVGVALIPLALSQEEDGRTDWIAATPLRPRIESMGRDFIVGVQSAPGVGLGIAAAALVALGLILVLVRGGPKERRGALIAGAIAASSVGVALLFALGGLDFLLARNLLPALVPLLIAVAAGLGAARAGRAGPALAGALATTWIAIFVALTLDESYHRHDWRSGLEELGPATETRGLLIAPGYASDPLIYYDHFPFDPNGEPIRVREVAVVGTYNAAEAPPRVPQLPGFELTERRQVQSIGIARYRAPTIRSVRMPPSPSDPNRLFVEGPAG